MAVESGSVTCPEGGATALGDEAAFVAERVRAAYPPAEAERALAGISAAAGRPVTLRANTLRTSADEVAAELARAGIASERVGWYPDALICRGIRERAIWELDAYRDGCIYLQSLSSMMPALALGPRAGADVLDMCAAPGGKTSQIAALSGGRARVTACEMKPSRADKLEHNLAKLGIAGVSVMRVDARRLDEFFRFDQVLLDAPCTGTGTARADDARALSRMTPQLLERTTRSQRALLDRALTVLKPGGVLVYSTCSILPEENGEQVERALARHRDCELVAFPPPPADGSADGGRDTGEAGQAAPAIPEMARGLADALRAGAVPTLSGAGPAGTVTVCPDRDHEGFFFALIKKSL